MTRQGDCIAGDCIAIGAVRPFNRSALWPATLEVKSTLTDRYQTTVAQTVCRALKLGKRDEIQYTIRPGGEVVLSRVEITEEDNPVLGQFLDFSVQRYCQPSRTAPDR